MNRLARVVRQPKLQLLSLLILLAAVALVRQEQPGHALLRAAIGVASALFAEWAFFGAVQATLIQSAAITGMLVGMILAPTAPLLTIWLTVVAAVASKKLVEFGGGGRVLNPATAGLVFATLFQGNHLNWWGFSSPFLVVIGAGAILFRLNRLSLPFAYFLARSLGAMFFSGHVGMEAFLAPNLFFAFIMLVEPKTSPGRRAEQWVFGGLCGFAATLLFRIIPGIDGDLLALLAANVSKAVWDHRKRHSALASAPAGAQQQLKANHLEG